MIHYDFLDALTDILSSLLIYLPHYIKVSITSSPFLFTRFQQHYTFYLMS